MADNKKMILNLFAGMQDALFLGDRFSNGEFVAFLQPGQFLSLNLKENAGSDDMAIQAEMGNMLIDSSYVNNFKDISYSGSQELLGSVSQVYSDVLNHAALPYKALDAPTIQEISDLQQWLASAGSNYELYRDRYFDAVEAYDTEAHKQSSDAGRLQRLAQKKIDANRNWEIFGQRNMYERKMGRLVYLTEEDPTSLWDKFRQKMEDQKQRAPNRGDYYQTFFVPSISSWQSSSWASFERNISDTETYEYSKNTSWSGGVSGGWGLWSFGGGTSGSTNYQKKESSISTVSLKFDYLRVHISRPWIVEDVFGYRFWTWKKIYADRLLSDGGNLAISPPVRPIGRMPILPKYLIVVRNVELSAAFSQQDYEWYHSETRSNASIGWGPFSLSGSYSESTTSTYVKGSFDGVTFRIDQPQIIARSGIMLPRSPDPIMSLPWQDDAWVPSVMPHSMEKDSARIRINDYVQSMLDERSLELDVAANELAASVRNQRLKAVQKEVEKALRTELARKGC